MASQALYTGKLFFSCYWYSTILVILTLLLVLKVHAVFELVLCNIGKAHTLLVLTVSEFVWYSTILVMLTFYWCSQILRWYCIILIILTILFVLTVFQLVLYGCLEVECLHQGCFMQCECVPYTPHINTLSGHPNRQL